MNPALSGSTIFVDDLATKTLATSKFFVIETERQVVSLTWRYRTRTVSLAALRNPDSAVPSASEQSKFCTQFRTGWRRPSAITGMTSRRGSPRPWKDLGERERGRPCRWLLGRFVRNREWIRRIFRLWRKLAAPKNKQDWFRLVSRTVHGGLVLVKSCTEIIFLITAHYKCYGLGEIEQDL